MKYKLRYPKPKKETSGGAYWQNADFIEHLKLTDYQTTYQYLINNYPPPLKILEAGCGLGRWVIPLAEKGYDVTGIELEEEAIKIIIKNYNSTNMTLVHGDVFKMPFTDKSFDIVISLGVLEHFEKPEIQKEAIIEHLRVLKDEGVFLITVPYLSFIRLVFHLPWVKFVSIIRKLKNKKEYFSEYRYSKNEFKKIISNSGLEIIDIVYDELLPPHNFGFMDYPIKKLFKDTTGQFKLNKIGQIVFKILWKIQPKLVSGGIGFICKKKI